MYSVLFFLLFALFCCDIQTKSLSGNGKVANSAEIFSFMKKYGYLESDSNSEAIYTKESFSDTIKTVQRFGGIEQTGEVDNATLQLLSSPRCGFPDIIKSGNRRKRYLIGKQKWRKRHLTFFVSYVPSNLDKESVANIIQKALDIWGKYGGLQFSRVNDPNADIIVLFARGNHGDSFVFDGPGKTLAHAFFPNDGLGGDAHFDEDEPWTTDENDNKEKIDFFSVAVHELGHSLGLGHSDVRTSIMFPYYNEPTTGFKLDYDDILAMYELYHKGKDNSDHPVKPTTRRTILGDRDSPSYPRPTRPDYNPTRRPHRPDYTRKPNKPRYTPTETPEIPDICEGRFDSIAMFRNELFIFKGKYLWRLRDKQDMISGYPAPFHQMFTDLPDDIKKIDAAYERPDGMIILFTGNNFWQFDGSRFVDSPRPLTDYGLPSSLSDLNAVQNWKANDKTYFYKGDRFWRYNEKTKTMDNGYPRSMKKWRGVPNDIDAALTWKDGKTYFFKDKLYWSFDNKWIMTTDNSPLPSPESWVGCPEDPEVLNYLSFKLDRSE